MAGVENGNVSNEEFMAEVARCECVYHGNGRYFKDKNERLTAGKKSGRNIIYWRYILFAAIFQPEQRACNFDISADRN